MSDFDAMIVRVRTGIATTNTDALGAAVDEVMSALRDGGDVKVRILGAYAIAAVSMIVTGESSCVLDELDATVARLGEIASA